MQIHPNALFRGTWQWYRPWMAGFKTVSSQDSPYMAKTKGDTPSTSFQGVFFGQDQSGNYLLGSFLRIGPPLDKWNASPCYKMHRVFSSVRIQWKVLVWAYAYRIEWAVRMLHKAQLLRTRTTIAPVYSRQKTSTVSPGLYELPHYLNTSACTTCQE